MKRIFYTFAAFLFIISACKKDNTTDLAKTLLIGNWNHLNISTKAPTGKYLKLNDGGSMESNLITGYNSYEVKNSQLIFKGSSGTIENVFVISSDSLYIEQTTPCTNPDGCDNLFARQK